MTQTRVLASSLEHLPLVKQGVDQVGVVLGLVEIVICNLLLSSATHLVDQTGVHDLQHHPEDFLEDCGVLHGLRHLGRRKGQETDGDLPR